MILVKVRFAVMFNFTELVTSFDINDILLTNGAATNLIRRSDSAYEATIVPIMPMRLVTINVPMGAANDTDGIGNNAASRTIAGVFPMGAIILLLGDLSLRSTNRDKAYILKSECFGSHEFHGMFADSPLCEITMSWRCLI